MYKRIALSGVVLGVFTLYAIHLRTDVEEHPVIAIKPPIASVAPSIEPSSTITPTGPTPIPAVTAAPTNAPTPKGKYEPQLRYKDGGYIGDVADAFYGNIQVQVTISGGKITDVTFLQYPSDRQTSIEINTQAMPLLKQEAIQAQSANVSGVSGATASSGAFIQSLQSALQKAV